MSVVRRCARVAVDRQLGSRQVRPRADRLHGILHGLSLEPELIPSYGEVLAVLARTAASLELEVVPAQRFGIERSGDRTRGHSREPAAHVGPVASVDVEPAEAG